MAANKPYAETADALKAAASLHHAYFTGLILTLVTRRSAEAAARWVHAVFRHQHHEKFLSSFEKLGLSSMPDAVACAAYHYLSNSVGGVRVQFMRESDRKAWVNFVPPRWIYPGAAICGVPTEVSRGFLTGWYAQNGVSLGNRRLGFVCTAQTTDGQHGMSGYFEEHDHDLGDDERLQFRPGELPPPFDAAAAPKLPAADWPVERLAKAERNYAMEYIRSGLPRLVELFGPAEGAYLGRTSARLVGAQLYAETAQRLGVSEGGAEGFAHFLQGLAFGEGDEAQVTREGETWIVRRPTWRLMRGVTPVSAAVFEAWNGLHEGAIAVHDRFLVLEPLARLDYGDDAFVWRIRKRSE